MSCGTQKAKYGIPMQHFYISFSIIQSSTSTIYILWFNAKTKVQSMVMQVGLLPPLFFFSSVNFSLEVKLPVIWKKSFWEHFFVNV